ncbi:hypothetical protein PV08_07184 [Exophiala spinifera]|uniref:Uncharacterized protein n=1 Tax=Exophiala spinifera TaxID=91928 RepID=A0A0D1ZNI7_9EURO|nr:uncharacterized protein PV08_07184 [Exophiala spinifera]KIW14402.1 hypothetical protein PV08_07184 [Exophiala spinifera]
MSPRDNEQLRQTASPTRNDGSYPELFWRLLENGDAMDAILNVPRHDVPENAVYSIKQCYNAFVRKTNTRGSRRRNTPDEPDPFEGTDEPEQNPENTEAQIVAEHAWGAIFIIKTLRPPEFIHAHLAKQASQIESSNMEPQRARAMALLTDVDFSGDPGQEKVGVQLAQSTRDVAHALKVRVTYTMDIAARSDMDRVRYCFTGLMWYDIVKLIRPDITGTRLGHLVKKDIRPLLEAVYTGNITPAWMDAILTEVSTSCKVGHRLNELSNRYGESCIFVLAGKLSKNFILSRFTTSGAVWERALRHMDQLKLGDLCREDGLLDLARQVRKLLIEDIHTNLAGYLQQNVTLTP